MGENAFWLWLLGIAWVMGPWLAFCFVFALGALAMRRASALARSIEKRPVEQGLRGYFAAWRNLIKHGFLVRGMLLLTIGCVMFAGTLGAGIQGLVQRSVEERLASVDEALQGGGTKRPRDSAESGEAVLSPSTAEQAVLPEGAGVLEGIVLAALILAGLIAIIGVCSYRALARRAAAVASRLSARDASRPLLVRMFHDNKKAGVISLVVGCWVLWGILNQIAAVLVVMLPPQIRNWLVVPGIMTVATIFLIVLGVLMSAVVFGPLAWLTWRNVKLQLRVVAQNRIARRTLHLQMAFLVGLLGMVLNLYLVESLGRLLWPGVFD